MKKRGIAFLLWIPVLMAALCMLSFGTAAIWTHSQHGNVYVSLADMVYHMGHPTYRALGEFSDPDYFRKEVDGKISIGIRVNVDEQTIEGITVRSVDHEELIGVKTWLGWYYLTTWGDRYCEFDGAVLPENIRSIYVVRAGGYTVISVSATGYPEDNLGTEGIVLPEVSGAPQTDFVDTYLVFPGEIPENYVLTVGDVQISAADFAAQARVTQSPDEIFWDLFGKQEEGK